MALHHQIAAHISWANTTNRTARTEPARAGLDAKFLADADGDPVRANHLRKAYYLRLAKKSADARKARRHADDLEAEVASALDGSDAA